MTPLRKLSFKIPGFFLLVCFVLWLAIPNRSGLPQADVAFIGYTTNVDGIQIAEFFLTNFNNSPITLQDRYQIQRPGVNPVNGVNIYQNQFAEAQTLQVQPGARVAVSVPVPTNEPVWRVCLKVKRSENRLRRIIMESCDALPLVQGAFKEDAFVFRSEWVK
jgi:hypothetical protein